MNAQSSLQTFTFDSVFIRTIYDANGKPLFCLADVCNALDLRNPTHAANQIKEEFSCPTLNVGQVSDPSGKKTATFITKSQLYFVMMRSRAQIARRFRQWIINEVLPALEEHGRYETPAVSTPALPKNELSEKDLQTIRDFIYSCSQTYTWGRCFSYAAWYALRKATGVKSPDKFEYKHMQTIIKELQRLQSITDYYHFTIAKIEQTLIKKIIRENGTPAELLEILNQMEVAFNNDKELEKVRQIKGWQSERLMSLAS